MLIADIVPFSVLKMPCVDAPGVHCLSLDDVQKFSIFRLPMVAIVNETLPPCLDQVGGRGLAPGVLQFYRTWVARVFMGFFGK